MRAQLLHLSGPYRGRTITYNKPTIVVGTTTGADVHFPSGLHVAERHAELTFVAEGCSFYLRALDGKVFVNRQQVEEVILSPDDLIEIGVDGPKMRFRVLAEGGPPCKPLRQMLRDAREVHGAGGLAATTRLIRDDMLMKTTWRRRAGTLVSAAIIALLAAYVGGRVGGVSTAKQQEMLRAEQADVLAKALAGIEQQMEVFRAEQAGHASREEVALLQNDLARRSAVIDALVQRNRALRTVLETYSQGVCLIHGIYGFSTVQDGETLHVNGADGSPLQIEYIGSGFSAGASGQVVTNRHVAEPWWNNDSVEPLLAQGMTPSFVSLTVTFPGHAPVAVDPSTIRLSTEGVDVAVFVAAVDGVPVLPLHDGDIGSIRGERVVVLGYPTGLNAILARAEPDLVTDILSRASDTASLIAELSNRGAIVPVITQGALNEVHPRRLVYDAETTSGGSGGPVFGPDGSVIGVNFAITRDFDGSNFGVPIQFATRLLSP